MNNYIVTKDEFINKYSKDDKDKLKINKIFDICTEQEILCANTEENLISLMNKLLAENCSYQSFLTDIDIVKRFMKENKVDMNTINCITPTRLYRMCTDWIISEKDIVNVLNTIDIEEEFNPEFYKALTLAIYEGIYDKDMAVLENLRASDIKRMGNGKNIVTLNNGKLTYEIDISDKLTDMLINMSKIHTWNKPIKRGGELRSVLSVNAYGKYDDSCFKFERRKNKNKNNKSFMMNYYRRIDVIQDYFRTIKCKKGRYTALNIYLSGIYNRINKELECCGYDTDYINKVIGEKKEIIIRILKKYRAYEVSKILLYMLNVRI